MNPIPRLVRLCLSAGAAAALALTPAIAAARLQVVASLPDLGALAREVGGDDVEVTTLARPNQDPHYVDARPSLLVPLSKADLLIVNGLELEVGWLPRLVTNARNPKIQPGGVGWFDASTVVERLQVPTQKIDRSMGDIHPGGNPHFTFDPRQGAEIARALGAIMARLDPERAAAYEARSGRLIAELEALIARGRARMADIPAARRRVAVFHQSLPYLLDWLQIEQVATLEPRPGIPPNPSHVAKVLASMRAQGARVIIQEDFYMRGPSETLAKLIKGRLLVIPGGTDFQGKQRYADFVAGVLEAIHDALASE
jgi:zinc/manganese transport system substrate-binding protein